MLRKLLDRQQCKREESFASVSFPVSQLSELGYPPNGLALKYLNSESIRVFTVVDATLLDRQTQHKHRTMRQPVGQQSLSTMSVRDVLRD